MDSRFTVVETSLNRAEFRWKWLRFLQRSFLLGAILCFLALVTQAAIVLGWIISKQLAAGIFIALSVGGFLAWAVLIITVAAGTPGRNWLAAAVERVDSRLLDRLNTLLFLEQRPSDWRSQSIAKRIARQTQVVLAEKPSPRPFSGRRSLIYFVTFTCLLATSILFYQRFSPWNRLLAAQLAKAAKATQPEQPLDLALPPTNNVEQDLPWGEVRITDPGADLSVTKVDVVPMQIEAAANQPLKQVSWSSTINGESEESHQLPAPSEPRFAVYQPNVYLDELKLSDWDVMTYYAKADTEQKNDYASDVFFLEVRPFREDILKLPGGGENGKAYSALKEMTALIARQQHIIRQTHLHIQKPLPQENLRRQDRKKLSEAEEDLGESVQHLYAKMASEMENKPIGDALDNLAKAEETLASASVLLQPNSNSMTDAQNRERNALSELVAARKIFQKAVSEHPKDFEEPPEQEQAPETAKQLAQMAEFRNEAKAAQEFVQKTSEQQSQLEQKARQSARSSFDKLASEEQELEKSLEQFQEQHPQAFKGAQAQAEGAQQAMAKAADALQNRSNDARDSTRQAGKQLEQLSQAMRSRSAEQQLADAYKLKQMLDRQAQTFNQYANSPNSANSPSSANSTNSSQGSEVSEETLQQTVADARRTLNQLKQAAEEQPTRDAFGQPLRDALSGDNKVNLDAKLKSLERARRLEDVNDANNRQQRAGEVAASLGKVSKAFEDSQPQAMQMAQKTDPLKPSDQDSFNQGMAELDSLIKQLQKPNPIPRQDQNRQGQEAAQNLQRGIPSLYGQNEHAQNLLVELDQQLKGESLNPEELKRLMDELQHFSVENSERQARKQDQPEVTNVDPSRLPPAYRGRIQKYFQKLSEK